jgi:hypothetical protein
MLDKAKDIIEKIAYIGRVCTWCADTLGAAIGSFPLPKKKGDATEQPSNKTQSDFRE